MGGRGVVSSGGGAAEFRGGPLAERVAVVLVRPEESRNVGAVCRSMANCGAADLRIVGWREDYHDAEVRSLALHAAAIWEKARFYDTVTSATGDCVFSAGTTRRRGKLRKGGLLLPEELAERAREITGKIAVVFGCERTGLTDAEMGECTLGVTIPSDEGFPSLNLSHAVQIVCYELYRGARERDDAHPLSPGTSPIDLARLDKTVDAIIENLGKVGFFTVHPPEEMGRFWRTVLSRAALTEGEAVYLEYIFHKAAGVARRIRDSNS
jgi:tRNA/rRNA methyltransferase